MRSAPLSCAVLVAATAFAAEPAALERRAAAPDNPSWEVGLTAYPTDVRGGENYTTVVAVADRGALHLEARYDYEAIGARSAFVGWTFSGGENITWELTPILGSAWGELHAVVPGLEASVGWERFDFYIEAEYVHDRQESGDNYTFAWSELGFKPVEWLRLGAVAQRTRAYGGEREVQRGPLVQFGWDRFTLGAYWFNPGSNEQVFVTSVGATF
jgi:hypothetical protein